MKNSGDIKDFINSLSELIQEYHKTTSLLEAQRLVIAMTVLSESLVDVLQKEGKLLFAVEEGMTTPPPDPPRQQPAKIYQFVKKE